MYHKIQIKSDYGEIDIYRSWIMALFLLEDRDFKGFWMKIWNAEVSVITRSTFSSLQSGARTHVVLVIGLYELLVIQLPNSLSHPGPPKEKYDVWDFKKSMM